jgi:cytochrome b involved in lipid metabolism
MADDKIFSYQDVAEHNTKNDMFVVIHDKVYDCTKFLDEHPYVPYNPPLPNSLSFWPPTNIRPSCSGGEEVMLDVAGQDSTEAFEDVGHSDEAREVLEKLYVGDLKRAVRIRPNCLLRKIRRMLIFSSPGWRPWPQERSCSYQRPR